MKFPDCDSKQRIEAPIERIFFIVLLFGLPPFFFLALRPHREIKYSAPRARARTNLACKRRPRTTKTSRCRWPPNFLSVALCPLGPLYSPVGMDSPVLSCGTYPRPCAIKANSHRFLSNIPGSTKSSKTFIYIQSVTEVIVQCCSS